MTKSNAAQVLRLHVNDDPPMPAETVARMIGRSYHAGHDNGRAAVVTHLLRSLAGLSVSEEDVAALIGRTGDDDRSGGAPGPINTGA